MGAQDFSVRVKGRTAREAFSEARDHAAYECGHGGYTGTIAEKHDFVMLTVPEGQAPLDYADNLSPEHESIFNDKWGPACCLSLGDGEYLFFGTASS